MNRLRPANAIVPLFAMLALGAATGCHRYHPDPLARCSALIGLPQRDPVIDADAAFGRNDARVLMLGGYASSAPGVDSFGVVAKASDIAKLAPYSPGTHFIIGRLLPGTTDYETHACRTARRASMPYVVAYNRRMLSHLPPGR